MPIVTNYKFHSQFLFQVLQTTAFVFTRQLPSKKPTWCFAVHPDAPKLSGVTIEGIPMSRYIALVRQFGGDKGINTKLLKPESEDDIVIFDKITLVLR